MVELLLDSKIRFWVFLPIMAITFLFGIIKHYLFMLLTNDKVVDMQQVMDSQALLRSRLIRENGRFLPKESFLMRKNYFANEESGFFVKQQRQTAPKMPMNDPKVMGDMLKGNFLNMVPMLVIGGWINWAFAGFLCTKVPFPLTFRFKPMLQKDVNLVTLDASWVSSASWYIINLFGLRSMYTLVLGENNGLFAIDFKQLSVGKYEQVGFLFGSKLNFAKYSFLFAKTHFSEPFEVGALSADQTKMMQDPMGEAQSHMAMPDDMTKAFKAEKDCLNVVEYNWVLKNIEQKLYVSDE